MAGEEERSRRLVKLRGKLSGNYVAKASGVAVSTYYALEKGQKRHFNQSIFEKLARTLNTTAEYIMFGIPKKNLSPDLETEGLAQIKMNLVETFLKIDDAKSLEKIIFFVKDQQEKADLQKKYNQLVTSSASKVEGSSSFSVENHEEVPQEKRGRKSGRKKKTDVVSPPVPSSKLLEKEEKEEKVQKDALLPVEESENIPQDKRQKKKKTNSSKTSTRKKQS
jgi:transcriptional regulator with XRE-family HTH domain